MSFSEKKGRDNIYTRVKWNLCSLFSPAHDLWGYERDTLGGLTSIRGILRWAKSLHHK